MKRINDSAMPDTTGYSAARYGDNAPIAALATPLAETALALIRSSGKESLARLSTVFSRPKQLLNAQGNSVIHGWIRDAKGQRIDETLISVYRAPHSYTGEDGADISCHGGIATVRSILRILHSAGFREALPGEFTFRAFMNGKLDLTRAESVMELVSAKTERARKHAVNRLAGGLEREIYDVKRLLVQVLAGTELLLDYSEDEDGTDQGVKLPDRPLAEEALSRMRALAASYRIEKLYHDGALVVIAGRPNAGKSSLFNILIKEERSIVTDVPGTTRDWVESFISIENIPIRLVDTAGLCTSFDLVEQLGIERSLNLLAAADLILYIIDGTIGITAEDADFLHDHAARPLIAVWNKADRAPSAPDNAIASSAKTGAGLTALCSAIAAALALPTHTVQAKTIGIATERQKACIDAALAALEEALSLADKEQSLDIIAPLLRDAVNALGELTGEVSTADILNVMFSRFCVGK
ncbi:MAG: tRNA uridine-5-carboxymethylaminomethyl(34) synthesis GTPase MnmE [Treponema sp.]|jgi:tRNA modification GTPase|nr:tRNA uridine-5-carboxymethylaminomethyl(34) synthesis GTPase MnmE [Treponema sp.]